jgi:hypothetical protein
MLLMVSKKIHNAVPSEDHVTNVCECVCFDQRRTGKDTRSG